MRESDKIMAEKCEVCEQWFDSKKALRAHENDKHSQKFVSLSVAVMAMIFISLMLFGCTQSVPHTSFLTMQKNTNSPQECMQNAQSDFMKACVDAGLQNCSEIWKGTQVQWDQNSKECTMQIPIAVNEKITRVV